MLPSSVRILVCTVPQDMRRSFDSLALVAKDLLGEDPLSGAVFVFVGKRPTRCKLLWWDRNGFCLLSKRLHRALFVMPEAPAGQGRSMKIDAGALAQLLAGVPHEGRSKRLLT
jgi:transposase